MLKKISIILMFLILSGIVFGETLEDFVDINKYRKVQDVELDRETISVNQEDFGKDIYKVQVFERLKDMQYFLVSFWVGGVVIEKIGGNEN